MLSSALQPVGETQRSSCWTFAQWWLLLMILPCMLSRSYFCGTVEGTAYLPGLWILYLPSPVHTYWMQGYVCSGKGSLGGWGGSTILITLLASHTPDRLLGLVLPCLVTMAGQGSIGLPLLWKRHRGEGGGGGQFLFFLIVGTMGLCPSYPSLVMLLTRWPPEVPSSL